MKVSNVINAANTNFAANSKNSAVPDKTAQAEKQGRFDTFTMIGENDKKTTSSLSTEKKELIRNLDNLSEEEKAEEAVASYIDMQKCCWEVLDRYETDIYLFNSFQEQKAYYNEMKNQGGVISEEGGKYAFAASSAGSVIDEKDIDAALSEVQKRINRLTMAPTEETARYELNDKIFRLASQAFAKVTGISDDALNLDDDSFCKVREGLTEENYLEKTIEAANLVKNRSEQLRSVMSDYTGRNSYAKEAMKNLDKFLKVDLNKEAPPLAEILEKYHNRIESLGESKSNLLFDHISETDQEDEEMKKIQD